MKKRNWNKPAERLIEKVSQALSQSQNNSSNIFLLQWKAGTGKSTLTNDLIKKHKHALVLGSTGIAAVNIWWKTVHSFFGLGVSDPDPYIQWYISLPPEKAALLDRAPFIVIDEVSMLHSNVIDSIVSSSTLTLSRFKHDPSLQEIPFGGKLVIFVWDMFQLPPVVTDQRKTKFRDRYESAFFFDSYLFKDYPELIHNTELDFNYRQDWDKEFAEILDRIRHGINTSKDLSIINSRLNHTVADNAILLTGTNKAADHYNMIKLSKIKWKPKVYEPKITGNYPQNMLPADPTLRLKVGAQVMMLNNDMLGRRVNWSIGVVKELHDDFVLVEIDNIEQSVSRHSRENSDESLVEREDDPTKMKVVKNVLGTYVQFPMKLAWAVTIHKSQWKTFKDVKIDIGYWGAFADAQTYVALSRCQSLDGISLIRGFKTSDIRVNSRVQSYYLSHKQ